MTDDKRRAKRMHRAELRLSGTEGRCGICGYDNPLALELHHVAGRKYDDTMGALCRNCHRIVTDLQEDHPPQIGKLPSVEERVVHVLLGLADFLEQLPPMLRRLANDLLALLRQRKVES